MITINSLLISLWFIIFYILFLHMASPFIAESIRSKRGKDKLVLFGFIYTLNRSTKEFLNWVCKKRGQCNARLTTRSDLVVVKPCDIIQIQETHTHGSDKPRIPIIWKWFTVMLLDFPMITGTFLVQRANTWQLYNWMNPLMFT